MGSRPRTPTQRTLSDLPTTSSPPGPTPSLTESVVTDQPATSTVSPRTTPQMPTPSTGSPLAASPQSRTRAHADHAGPSLPPDPWRVPTALKETPSSPSP